MSKKEKILMVVPFQASFIRNDIDILSASYRIVLNRYNWKNKVLVPLYMLMQGVFMLRYVFTVRKIVVEFGGYWALVPSLFGKLFNVPVFIVLHGTDCASMPSIHYGNLRSTMLRQVCKLSYSSATRLLPVSSSLVYTENDYNTSDIRQGVKHYFPELTTDIRVVHNGLALDFWSAVSSEQKESKRFTAVFSSSQFVLKGGDLIIALAQRLTDCHFYIIGCEKPEGRGELPTNVHFLGKLTRTALREQFRKARFHLQLSMFEGFGMALCEAMLCECIPIGSSVNSIPEIIGDTGFLLAEKDLEALYDLVNMAISTEGKKALGVKARERVVSNYSIEKRAVALVDAIETV